MHERIFGLVLINRAGLGLKARDQAKPLDGERFGAEPRMRGKELVQLLMRGITEPRQRDATNPRSVA